MRRTRHPSSDAILDLREALGITQPELARRLKSSRTSIARYETSMPPSGDVLLRLAEFADNQRLPLIAERFRQFYIEDFLSTIARDFTRTADAGYLTVKLSGQAECAAGEALLGLLDAFRSGDPDWMAKAAAMSSKLQRFRSEFYIDMSGGKQ